MRIEAGGLRALAGGAGAESGPSLREAARAFESLLVQQMLRQADRPLAGERWLDGGPAGRMYRELFFEEIAKLAARRGRFGVATLLEGGLGGTTAATPSADRGEEAP